MIIRSALVRTRFDISQGSSPPSPPHHVSRVLFYLKAATERLGVLPPSLLSYDLLIGFLLAIEQVIS